jgi:hypothetical protein
MIAVLAPTTITFPRNRKTTYMFFKNKSKPDVTEALKQLPRLVVDLAIADWNAYVSNSRFPQAVQPPPIGAIPNDRQDLHALFGECLSLHHFFLQLALMERPAVSYRQQFLPALAHSYGSLATAIRLSGDPAN